MAASLGYAPSRLYRADGFWPLADILDTVLLTDQTGPVKKYDSSFYQVTGIEPVQGIGTHGLLSLWTQGTIPAGYTQPSGAVTGTINSGASLKSTPVTLQQNPRTVLSMRFVMKALALTGPVVQDIDLQAFLPGAVARWSVANDQGRINAQDQMFLPADSQIMPAQGALIVAPTTAQATQTHPKSVANLSEMNIFEINGPSFVINNNGASNLTAGTIGLVVWGFRYDLVPLKQGSDWVLKNVMGRAMAVPPVPFVVIPTAASVPQSQ